MFELGQKIKNCTLCYYDGKFDDSSGASREKLNEYMSSVIPVDVHPNTIWYDAEDDVCFSECVLDHYRDLLSGSELGVAIALLAFRGSEKCVWL